MTAMACPTSGPTPPAATSTATLRLLEGLAPGTRVSVRYALPDDDASGLPLTDALGELVGVDSATVRIRTRRGDVLIAPGRLRAARVVPPAPPRRPPRQR